MEVAEMSEPNAQAHLALWVFMYVVQYLDDLLYTCLKGYKWWLLKLEFLWT